MALASQRWFASRHPGSRAFVRISVDLAHQTAPVGQNHQRREAGARSVAGRRTRRLLGGVAARRAGRSLGAASGLGRRLEPWQRRRLASVERYRAGCPTGTGASSPGRRLRAGGTRSVSRRGAHPRPRAEGQQDRPCGAGRWPSPVVGVREAGARGLLRSATPGSTRPYPTFNGMPTSPAMRLAKSVQSLPSRPST
jgi:hypothetical protein